MISSIVKPARALLLPVVAALVLASQLAVAHAAPETVIPHVVPSQVSSADLVLAQAAPTAPEPTQRPPRPKTEAEQRNDEQAAALRAFIQGKVKEVMGSGLMAEVQTVLPQMWDAFKLAVVVVFLIAFVAFHFQRQKRAMLEAEQERELSPAELEFGRDPDLSAAGGQLINEKETS
jgi:cbb3-type cytochrome oxidase subunit 3